MLLIMIILVRDRFWNSWFGARLLVTRLKLEYLKIEVRISKNTRLHVPKGHVQNKL
jgi:hypothetical protein